jgi:hypothetical protein
MAGKRYYSDDDEWGGMFPPRGITSSQLKRLGRERQKNYLRHWFSRNFEDPVQETPWVDGQYLYAWGGPYDAKDELFNEFGDLVSEEVIDAVVGEVEREGTHEWAPGPDHPDQQAARDEWYASQGRPDETADQPEALGDIVGRLEAGVQPVYGDARELEFRKKVIERLDKLEHTLTVGAATHGGMGHNRPPPDIDDQQAQVIKETREAGAAIRRELGKPEPDALQVAKVTSRLQTILGWLGGKVDAMAHSFAEEFGGTFGKLAAAGAVVTIGAIAVPQLRALLAQIVDHVTRWLSYVSLSF